MRAIDLYKKHLAETREQIKELEQMVYEACSLEQKVEYLNRKMEVANAKSINQ